MRLFPSHTVPAFVELVVMDEFRIRLLCPTPRGFIELVWKAFTAAGMERSFGAKNASLFSQQKRAEEIAVFVNQ